MNKIITSYNLPADRILEIKSGDITGENVDAIVNAANSHLKHGAGVAGAIVEKGGYQIQAESDAWVELFGIVSHEKPAITAGGLLPCKYIIHAVGPIWGSGEEINKLGQAIFGSLREADHQGLSSIAFPAISTGIFGFPIELAARVFVETIYRYFLEIPNSGINSVKMILFDGDTIRIFIQEFNTWLIGYLSDPES